MSTQAAIITGASGALGGELLRAGAAAGWRLGLVAHGEAGAARLRAAAPGAAVARADLADAEAARAALAGLDAQLGGVDALFNIAGGFAMADALDTSPEALEAQLAINFRSAVNASRALLPGMLERGRGFILGVGAAAALDGGAGVGAYAASKAALVTWLKSLRAEVAPRGVSVAILYPMGAIDTPGNRAAMPQADPQAWIDPAALVETMLFLAARPPRGRLLEARVHPPA